MKAYLKLLIVPLLIATACSPSYVGTSAFQDDIYYVPGEASLIDTEMAVYTTHAEKKEPTINQSTKVKSETTFNDGRSFQLIQEQYQQMIQNDSIEMLDTTFYNDDQGYYLYEFEGSEWDREEAESLRRMYPQGFGYYDGSGYTMAMWLAGNSDWNVYIDGNKVWWTPTWHNYNAHSSFQFSPYRYGRNFAYSNYHSYCGSGFMGGFSYYDDLLWSMMVGWGSPYSYYGHGYHPYYGHGYNPYYGHNHHHGTYPANRYSNDYYGHRSSVGSKTGTSRGYTNRSSATRTQGTVSRVNRSANYTKSGTTTRRSATTAKDAVRRSTAAQRYGSRNSRSSYGNRAGTSTRRTNTRGTVSRSNYQGTTTRYGTQNRSTYRGSKSGTTTKRRTSNYTKPRSNSRPSYNSSGTRRSTNSRATSTRNSRYNKVKSTPSYKRSSTKSSSSSYRPTRSTSTRSSGAVRSSGSSSKSSSGGTRRSGGNRRR